MVSGRCIVLAMAIIIKTTGVFVLRKFRGSFVELQELVAATGIDGEWVEQGPHKQYRTDNGAILNFWSSTGTVNFQGPPSAAQELEAAIFRAGTGSPGACRSQPNDRGATMNDPGLEGLISSIIKNRVGPIFDDESAFIAKVAEQCMLDLVEQLGFPAGAKENVGTPPPKRPMDDLCAEGDR